MPRPSDVRMLSLIHMTLVKDTGPEFVIGNVRYLKWKFYQSLEANETSN